MKLRKLMAGILSIGLALWMALTASRVLDSPLRFHFHGRKGVKSRADVRLGTDLDGPHLAPFWPCFSRKLLGRSWPGEYVCPDQKPPFDGAFLPNSRPGDD
jgi:hypothetical protein